MRCIYGRLLGNRSLLLFNVGSRNSEPNWDVGIDMCLISLIHESFFSDTTWILNLRSVWTRNKVGSSKLLISDKLKQFTNKVSVVTVETGIIVWVHLLSLFPPWQLVFMLEPIVFFSIEQKFSLSGYLAFHEILVIMSEESSALCYLSICCLLLGNDSRVGLI